MANSDYYLDYSEGKLSGSVIRTAGYSGVIRYIDSPANLSTKHTNKAEYDSHVAAGVGVQLVFQTTTTASDGGYQAGVDHAKRALAGSNYLGYTGRIFFTNDRTTVPNIQTWDDYLTGACSVLGASRVGAYGFANAMDIAVRQTPVTGFWLAGAKSGITGRPYLNFWQDNNTQVTVGGILCDRNLILKGDEVSYDDAYRAINDWMLGNTGGPGGRNVRDSIYQGAIWAADGLTATNAVKAAVAAVDAKVAAGGMTPADKADLAATIAQAVINEVGPETAGLVGEVLRTSKWVMEQSPNV